jgi:hypothetical protein
MGKNPTGLIFYKHTSDTIVKGTESGHPDARLRTRYQSVAAEIPVQTIIKKIGQ